MNGCVSMSNTAAKCDGSNLGLDISFAVGSNSGCGARQLSNAALQDPYNSLKSNIPPNPCAPPSSQEEDTKHGNSYTVANPLNNLTGPISLRTDRPNFMCGDQILTADVTINTPFGHSPLLVVHTAQPHPTRHQLTISNLSP